MLVTPAVVESPRITTLVSAATALESATASKPATAFISATPFKPAGITATVMIETSTVETSAVEISPMISLEEGTVVFEVYAIPEVTIPGGIVIIYVSGEFGFTDLRIGIIAAVIHGCRLRISRVGLRVNRLLLIDYRRSHWRRADIDPRTGDTESDVRINIYL